MQMQKRMIEGLLYPAMERLKGNRIRTILGELKASQSGGAEELQRERLIRLLEHCRNCVPAYRDLDLEGIKEDPYRVLREAVPPLPKAEFQKNSQLYLADNIPPEGRIPNLTGGSTGEPIRFFMSRGQVEAYEAARWRGLSWYGITPGSRSAMLWGSPIELSKKAQLKQRITDRWLKNRVILSAYDLTEERLTEHLRFLGRFKPEYLYGYSTILTAFAKMTEERGLKLPFRPKVVVSTSETLEETNSRLLSRVFGCPVANEYGARDAGIIAYACPNGRLHLTAENCVVEVLDPITLEPLPVGESGALAITDLGNLIQPRLRYMLGDVGALSAEPCDCGRLLPVLARIDGRLDDLLVGHGGALVHGHVLGQLMQWVEGLQGFQFRQHSPEKATLLLVKATPEAVVDEADIKNKLSLTLPDTEVDIQYVPSIPLSASGKLRYAIREFPL